MQGQPGFTQCWLWFRPPTSLDETEGSQLEQEKAANQEAQTKSGAVERSSNCSCIWIQCQKSSERQRCHMASIGRCTYFINKRTLSYCKEDRENVDRWPRLPRLDCPKTPSEDNQLSRRSLQKPMQICQDCMSQSKTEVVSWIECWGRSVIQVWKYQAYLPADKAD